MKIIILASVFALILAGTVLAAGLEIAGIDVHVEYDEAYTYRLEDRDRKDAAFDIINNSRIDVEVLPGSNVTFTLAIENTLRSDGPDLRDITALITIEDIDDGADLEEGSADFDLEAGNDERVDIRFFIPLDVNPGTYDVIIEAEADDRNETVYESIVNLKLEVRKQSHDIRITKYSLNPSVVTCERKVEIKAEAMNLGSRTEDGMILEFEAPSLGIDSADKGIVLEALSEGSDEDATYSKSLDAVLPRTLNAGKYPIMINFYWKESILFDRKTANLVVRDCGAYPANESNESAGLQNETPEDQQNANGQQTGNAAPRQTSLLESPAILIALGIGFLVIAIAVAGVIIYSKPKG